MALRSFVLVTVLAASAGCSCSPEPTDDAGLDAGQEEVDAGVDASVDASVDAGPADAGVDAGPPDAGAEDAGPGDGGCVYRLEALSAPWTTGRPLALELADLNGDGHLDIVLANTSTLQVRLNDGQGGFPGPSLFGPVAALTLVVAELGGDGLLDVLAVDGTGVLTLLTGDGDGGLTVGATFDAGGPFFVPQDTALGDVDGDGLLDAVTIDVGSSQPELRTVRGVFGDAGTLRAPNGSHRLLLADVTGDGLVDALLGNGQYGLELHPGDGDGGFGPETTFLAATAVNAFALRDVTGDGVPDAVCASGYYDGTLITGGGVSVLAGTGNDAGFLAPAQDPNSRDIIWALVLADLNRDGFTDVVSTRLAFDGGTDVLLGDDAGGFTAGPTVPGRNGWALAVGDLNQDGWPDVAVGSGAGSNGEVRVLLGSCQER